MIFFLAIIIIGMMIGSIFYNSLICGMGFSLLGIIAFPVYKKSIIEKKKQTILEQFKDLLYSISFSISSGRNMAQSLKESKEFWNSTYDENDFIMIEINNMLRRIEEGNELDVIVLRDLADRYEIDDINDFVNTFELLKETGGNMSLAINRASTLIGDKISMEKEVKTSLSQKVFEGKIVTCAPLFMVTMIKMVSPSFIGPLYESAKGMYISTLSLGMMCIAAYLIWKITKIEI